MEDMVASVREHGILNPVIVQEIDGGYEMLSGHNRMNAAKLVGLKEIPAIVKTDLSEEEAYVYVIETNLMQRSFSDLLISEKAAVLKARYEKESCQGRRNDIIEEIARMEGKELPATCGHGDQRLNTRDMIGKEYELSGSSVGRLLKLNDLIKPFKDMVDRGALYTKVALQLAFLSEEEQNMVFCVMNEEKTKITSEMVANLRSHSGSLTEAKIKRYLSKNPIKKKCYKVPARIVEKYFAGMDPNTVDSIVEQAGCMVWRGECGCLMKSVLRRLMRSILTLFCLIIRISRFRAGIPVIIGICTVQSIRKSNLLSYFISTFSDAHIISMERRIH